MKQLTDHVRQVMQICAEDHQQGGVITRGECIESQVAAPQLGSAYRGVPAPYWLRIVGGCEFARFQGIRSMGDSRQVLGYETNRLRVDFRWAIVLCQADKRTRL